MRGVVEEAEEHPTVDAVRFTEVSTRTPPRGRRVVSGEADVGDDVLDNENGSPVTFHDAHTEVAPPSIAHAAVV